MKVRCDDCAHRINLLGNTVNIMCGVTNRVEPLGESLDCDDYKSKIKAQANIKKKKTKTTTPPECQETELMCPKCGWGGCIFDCIIFNVERLPGKCPDCDSELRFNK